MIQPLDQLVQQFSRTDQQLQYYLIIEQQETNRLLRQLIGEKEPVKTEETENLLNGLKRPELMKRIAKLENKPQGWNTWGTEEMRKYLKEAS